MSTATETGLVHRTHALALTLEELRRSLDRPRVYPLSPTEQRHLGEAAADLQTRIRQFQAEPALLTVVFVGGTGVGKSTLLNALAGGKIAESGIARPTTQIPTVYHHREVHLDRLDPIFKKCKAVVHDRSELRQKILVDTPDMDGNIREHHDRLREVLPVADAVLYIGSQEKYHDREAWKILLDQRGSRGFAFVLNKWDRCVSFNNESAATAPDQDFRESLREAGFPSPMVFRTCAAHWVRQRTGAAAEQDPIPDDFLKLEQWIEAGLDERAIREIKSRGIAGKIDQVITQLDHVTPPDWGPKSRTLEHEWQRALREALSDYSDLLIEAADKHASAFERHFGRLGRSNFRGMFGIYLKVIDRLGRLNMSVLPAGGTHAESKIEELAARSVATIPAQARDAQRDSLHDHLLALADARDWPIDTFRRFLPDEQTDHLSDETLAEAISSQLLALEKEFSEPKGAKLATRVAAKALCEWGPPVVAVFIAILWLYDMLTGDIWGTGNYLSAAIFIAIVFGGLHLLLYKLVPVHWEALREQLRRLIESRLLERVAPRYYQSISDFTTEVQAERSRYVASLNVLRDLRDQLRRAEQTGMQSTLFARPQGKSS